MNDPAAMEEIVVSMPLAPGVQPLLLEKAMNCGVCVSHPARNSGAASPSAAVRSSSASMTS